VKPRILISDTVGFIKKLPHGLVASFRATLEVARDAQLLLHVVDSSDPAFRSHIEVTRTALTEIGAADQPALLLLNKVDRIAPSEAERLREEFPDAILMSAKRPPDVAALHDRIVAFFERDMEEGEVFVPYDRQAVVNEVHQTCRVLAESYEELGVRLRIKAHPPTLARFRGDAA
jgi:GTP-binding protein HflX